MTMLAGSWNSHLWYGTDKQDLCRLIRDDAAGEYLVENRIDVRETSRGSIVGRGKTIEEAMRAAERYYQQHGWAVPAS